MTNFDRSFCSVSFPSLLLFCAAIFGNPLPANAGWPPGEIPLCEAVGYQSEPNVAPDGSGGAVFGWLDFRSGSSVLYAQRVDGNGTVLWTADGVFLQSMTGAMIDKTYMVGDGSGGLIYVWLDNGDLYAQHVNASGNADWNPDTWGFAQPVPVSTNVWTQQEPRITEDGVGGVIVVWRSGADIYAQRVNASGIPQWTTDGIPVCAAANGQTDPSVSLDGSGGVFVSWTDERDFYLNIYTQRIDSSGNALWTTDGVRVSEPPTGVEQNLHSVVMADGTGGAIVAWQHAINASATVVQSQRVDGAGGPVWTRPIGVSRAGSTVGWTCAATGDGGLLSTWVDRRDFAVTSHDIYVAGVDSTGAAAWADSAGVAVCTEPGLQQYPSIAMGEAGVAWVTWGDKRSGDWDIYSQQVDSYGALLGAAGGDVLDNNPWALTAVLHSIPGVGVVAAYTDRRNGNDDVFATMLGEVVTAAPLISSPGTLLSMNWPNPFGSSTTFRFSIVASGRVDLAVYDLKGRRVRTLADTDYRAGHHIAAWDGTADGGMRMASGVYFLRLRAGGTVVSRRVTLLR